MADAGETPWRRVTEAVREAGGRMFLQLQHGGRVGHPVAHRIRFAVEVVRAVAAEIGPERVGARIAPGLTVNGIEEGDTQDIYPTFIDALTEVGGLAYVHVVFADPDQPLFQEIRKAWSGVLIANPVLGWGGRCPPTAAGTRPSGSSPPGRT